MAAKKKLSEQTELPTPPDEALALAQQLGADLRAYDPQRVREFMEGHLTLGELMGISKDDQYTIAKTGYGFLNEGKHAQAKTVFEGLLALDPYDAYFNTVLGSIAQQSGALDEADRRYTRALEINPYWSVPLAHRGEVRLSQGKVMEAISDFIDAVKNDPKAEDPATQRARALLGTIQSQLEASAEDPERALRDARAAEAETTSAPAVGKAKGKVVAAAAPTTPAPPSAGPGEGRLSAADLLAARGVPRSVGSPASRGRSGGRPGPRSGPRSGAASPGGNRARPRGPGGPRRGPR
jgi:tetratricopeptide (TPR) repeat protein